MSCKSCQEMNNKTKYQLRILIDEDDEKGLIYFCLYYIFENLPHEIPLSDFCKELNEVRNEFMFQNPFFSSKVGVIEYGCPKMEIIDKDGAYDLSITHDMIIDAKIISREKLEKLVYKR